MTGPLRPEDALPDEGRESIDLTAVGADDRLLDDLGAGRLSAPVPVEPDLFAESTVVDPEPSTAAGAADPVAGLLASWRASLRPDDLPEPPAAPAHRAAPRRRTVPIVAAAASIVALLFGTAAVGARTAGPDDVLWPLTRMLWPDRIESVEAKEHAEVALDLARTALEEGITPHASSVLTSAAVDISKVQDRDGRAELDADYEHLWTRLQELGTPAVTPSTDAVPAPPSTAASSEPSAPPSTSATTSGSSRPSPSVPPVVSTTPTTPTGSTSSSVIPTTESPTGSSAPSPSTPTAPSTTPSETSTPSSSPSETSVPESSLVTETTEDAPDDGFGGGASSDSPGD